MRDRLDLALDGAGLALWDYDVRSGDVYLGPHWNEMLGGERVEVTTGVATLQKMMHPDDAGQVSKLMRDIVRGSSDSYRAEHRVQMVDGRWKWIESHGKVVARDAHGVAVRMTGINADISERKEVERLKSEFVATVSHELRTPLTAIIGGLGMVRSDVLGSVPADARPLLDMAYQNSERLRDLINNILDLEKMDSGVMNHEAQVIDVADTLRRAAALNQAYAQTLSVRFELDLPAEQPQVQADPDRLMQVLTNLLSNAAKFSPKNESVTLSCRIAGDNVRIGIRDRGPGIPQDFRGRIFGKFAQADSSDTRQKGGTGLGLSIAKSLVERMRGTIDYVSESGRGTTFFVELPLYGVVATATRAEPSRTT
jgi:PAS domain S-box-containing protein